MYSTWEKRTILFSIVSSVLLAIAAPANAMHIMEGFLPPIWAISWGAVSLPFLVAGYIAINKRIADSPKVLVLLALCGAFAFVLSALKIPSVTGSSSHPTGVGLGAILFGPFAMSIIAVIVLLFQAILLAHGGLTTLGANTFSMGIVGPIISWFVYRLGKKVGANTSVAVFLAAFLGDLSVYVTTALQLALAHPTGGSVMVSLLKFIGIFGLTQLPLAVCEGLVTVAAFNVIHKYQAEELKQLHVI